MTRVSDPDLIEKAAQERRARRDALPAVLLYALGVKVVGVLGEPHGPSDRTCTAGILRDIVSGKPYQIHLETPPNHTKCDIDAAGVETACAAVINDVLASDLVVLSKFGKLEAMRRGLATAFEAAIAAGKPVLTTVSDRHRDAWQVFAPDAILVPAGEAAIQIWWRAVQNTPGSGPIN